MRMRELYWSMDKYKERSYYGYRRYNPDDDFLTNSKWRFFFKQVSFKRKTRKIRYSNYCTTLQLFSPGYWINLFMFFTKSLVLRIKEINFYMLTIFTKIHSCLQKKRGRDFRSLPLCFLLVQQEKIDTTILFFSFFSTIISNWLVRTITNCRDSTSTYTMLLNKIILYSLCTLFRKRHITFA